MSTSDPATGWRATLHRWRTENREDTREPEGPEGRVYTVPFANAWDEVTGLIERRPRWTLRHRDEDIGIISVICRTPLFRFTDDLTIWVSLDRDGLTRVDVASRSRVGKGDLGVNRRRIDRLLRRLDTALGEGQRLVDRRHGARASS